MNTSLSEPEPIWRQLLNWGCVVYFFLLPALAIFLGFSHISFGLDYLGQPTQITAFLREFHFAVTALVAAVAGLNSYDRRTTANGQTPPKPEPPEYTRKPTFE